MSSETASQTAYEQLTNAHNKYGKAYGAMLEADMKLVDKNYGFLIFGGVGGTARDAYRKEFSEYAKKVAAGATTDLSEPQSPYRSDSMELVAYKQASIEAAKEEAELRATVMSVFNAYPKFLPVGGDINFKDSNAPAFRKGASVPQEAVADWAVRQEQLRAQTANNIAFKVEGEPYNSTGRTGMLGNYTGNIITYDRNGGLTTAKAVSVGGHLSALENSKSSALPVASTVATVAADPMIEAVSPQSQPTTKPTGQRSGASKSPVAPLEPAVQDVTMSPATTSTTENDAAKKISYSITVNNPKKVNERTQYDNLSAAIRRNKDLQPEIDRIQKELDNLHIKGATKADASTVLALAVTSALNLKDGNKIRPGKYDFELGKDDIEKAMKTVNLALAVTGKLNFDVKPFSISGIEQTIAQAPTVSEKSKSYSRQ